MTAALRHATMNQNNARATPANPIAAAIALSVNTACVCARQAVLRSKGMLGVITAFAGQWPHATYMAAGE